MILLVATLLVAVSGYAESKDSLKVENVMSVENPERVTITESDNRLMVEIDGKKDNPSFRYVREVEISPSDVSVTKERSGNWDFNIPFRKRTPEQRHKRNEFVVKDFKIGLSTVQGAPRQHGCKHGLIVGNYNSNIRLGLLSLEYGNLSFHRTGMQLAQLPDDRQTSLRKRCWNRYVYRQLSRGS